MQLTIVFTPGDTLRTPSSTIRQTSSTNEGTPSTPALNNVRIVAVRNASKVDRTLKEIPPAATYSHTNQIPVCRYISSDYKNIFNLIKMAVHEKLRIERMTDELYDAWKMGAHNVIKYVPRYF